MSDDEFDIPRKKSIVGLALVVGMGIWIGVGGKFFDLPGLTVGWCVVLVVLFLFGRWKPS
ncbi:MAG: hypothetical protein WBN30_14070 [Polyangiales bacterium]